jgi:zinc protease
MPPGRSAFLRPERFTLANGLKVLLAPDPSSPTASVWVWYRVGAKNEWPGVTGASHWVEHMLFQGSPKYRKGEIDAAVVGVGGRLNAFTDNDFTAYFTTVPRDHLEVPLAIEADRMTRATIAPREVERERTVIRSEREGNENWPEFRVEEELYALAFVEHPYRWDALGYPADILSLTPEDLQRYYHRFYGPKNAVLVVSGGFDATALRADIRRRFSTLPAAGDDPHVRRVEPPLRAERRSTLRGPGTNPLLAIGYPAPSIGDPTAPAVMLLDAVLGGDTRLFAAGTMWGRASDHPSSRMYRALVDTGLAVRAASEWRPRVHPGLFTFYVQAAEGVSFERIEAVIGQQVRRIARDGPTRTEMTELRTKIERGAALAYEGATRTGFRLGYFEMLGPEGLERRLYRKLLATPATAVRAAAARLFDAGMRVIVRYEPTPGGEPADA